MKVRLIEENGKTILEISDITIRVPMRFDDVEERMKSMHRLTGRQRQVLDGILARMSDKEIADKIHTAVCTTKFHVRTLLKKFGVANRYEIIDLINKAKVE